MKIQVRRAANSEWYWRIVSDNNEILTTSETMHNKQDVIDIAQKVRTELVDSDIEVDD